MSFSYDPDNGAYPVLPWNISFLSQRDVVEQVPINFITDPGVSLQAACFGENRYVDNEAALCFSNLLAIGFRRIIIDIYWDVNRSVWGLCPVAVPSASTNTLPAITAGIVPVATGNGFYTTTYIAPTSSSMLRASSSVSGTSTASTQSPTPSTFNARGVTQISLSTTTITITPSTSGNITYIAIPTPSPESTSDTIYAIGPYICTNTLDFQPFLNILNEYILTTDDTLHAFINTLIINIHAAASPFRPRSPPLAPNLSSLPTGDSSIGSIINNAFSLKLYTPTLLSQQRQNINASWLNQAGIPNPLADYFTSTRNANDILSTASGWPDGYFLQVGDKRRILASFGSIDPQMDDYDFQDDIEYVFPQGYIQREVNITSSANGSIETGCQYQEGVTSLPMANSSWSVTSDFSTLPGNDLSPNGGATNPLISDITACGISPVLNETLGSVTANINYTSYQAFAYSTIWSWAPGQPQNDSADANLRCAVSDPLSNGRWAVANCQRKYHGACVSTSSPYKWTVTSSSQAYSALDNACPDGYTFTAPRTALENAYLREAHSRAVSTNVISSDSLLWLNLNSLDVEFCWVAGTSTKCPYVQASQVERIAVPTIAGVIVLVVAGLLILIKCGSNRKTSRRTRKGDGNWDYEGVPS